MKNNGFHISSVESQKGIITINNILLRNRRALSPYKVYGDSVFWFSREYCWTVLAPLLVLSWQCVYYISLFFILQTFDKMCYKMLVHTCSHYNNEKWICINIPSVESQKGITAVQRCSVESQKGTITIDFVQP